MGVGLVRPDRQKLQQSIDLRIQSFVFLKTQAEREETANVSRGRKDASAARGRCSSKPTSLVLSSLWKSTEDACRRESKHQLKRSSYWASARNPVEAASSTAAVSTFPASFLDKNKLGFPAPTVAVGNRCRCSEAACLWSSVAMYQGCESRARSQRKSTNEMCKQWMGKAAARFSHARTQTRFSYRTSPILPLFGRKSVKNGKGKLTLYKKGRESMHVSGGTSRST